ncbi:MAG: hypothetical protein R3Y35_00680, partial [Clostridia bacterium]
MAARCMQTQPYIKLFQKILCIKAKFVTVNSNLTYSIRTKKYISKITQSELLMYFNFKCWYFLAKTQKEAIKAA